ncbi:glycoside hydrolase family 65 protein [Pseudalkalibacillus sp. A8]|uniref:glycoside hydrolase family 65 protein n=1 Tax=Pseudalkalibacillus sp. A8 TaxID=3382641 RepID=UPI0038B6990F
MINQQVINDEKFDLRYLNKFATLMTLGNGYLGLRGTYEEDYPGQTRGMYIAGIYNKMTPNESSDLVNLPDLVGIRIEIDGSIFSLQNEGILSYKRELALSNGEINREILWRSPTGNHFHLSFKRFVSKDDLHTFASKVTIKSLEKTANVKIVTGIDAQQTNFGRQHLIEDKIRVHNEQVMQGVYRTTESGHTVAIATSCVSSIENEKTFTAKNRQLLSTMNCQIPMEEPLVIEKIATIYTSLDQGKEAGSPEKVSLSAIHRNIAQGYDALLSHSTIEWEKFWEKKRVKITSSNKFDQLALDFALYHIEIMTPSHDERFSVGAKGLTGEGYKGHVFWDAEMFIAPHHMLTEPSTARKLLRYRYLRLKQAKEKASKNGFNGALFPWESAFSGKEETPEFAAINIRTGDRQKVASAIAEHHIVADIAFAVVQYYQSTNDDTFMKKEGLALLKETSRFWISRTTEKDGRLTLKDVIGPDEYTEHIDNNAYTNYMAYHNVEKALYFMGKYGDLDVVLVNQYKDFLNRLYLPKPNEKGLIPQDDTFLRNPEINLSPYKKNQGSQSILLDFSRKEVNEMQILKQADVVMLLYLFPNLFPSEVVLKNLHYYEDHTIHDSSLSKAIHAIVASRTNQDETAYRFFQEACLIDLGPNPHSSDEGIHAASLGALWLAVVFGFANLSIENGVKINPKLPKKWNELVIPLHYRGRRLKIKLTHQDTEVTMESGNPLKIEINGKVFLLTDKIVMKKKDENSLS